jgi:hypothetical protein
VVVSGTGFDAGALLRGEGEVLTRWHAVQGATDVGVVLAPQAAPGQGAIRGRVVRIDEAADLALVRLAARPPQGLTLAPAGDGARLPAEGSDKIRAFLARGDDRAEVSAPQVAGANGAACVPRQVVQGRNDANTGLVASYDMRCTGRVDLEIFVPDDEARPILMRGDRNLDGKPDMIIIDESRQGRWSLSYWDAGFDGSWALVGHHPDARMAPTYFEQADSYRARVASR